MTSGGNNSPLRAFSKNSRKDSAECSLAVVSVDTSLSFETSFVVPCRAMAAFFCSLAKFWRVLGIERLW